MKVLLVDDDAFLRDMYATKFKESGHEVDAAETGEEGLKKMQAATFDVVLLDMVMPGISGIEFLEAAVKERKAGTKLIVLSNQSEPSDKESATQAGANGYIVKAESIPSDVVKEVEKLCRGNS